MDNLKIIIFDLKRYPLYSFLHLSMSQLCRWSSDMQAKVEELEFLNKSIRAPDKTKDDSISMLADQILTLTERLKDLERKQQQFQYG